MKKLKYYVLVSASILVIFAFTIGVFAESESTQEFGIFSYDLIKEGPCDRCSDVRISGYTAITNPKPSTKVMVTAELQYASTGQTITTFSDSNTGGTRASISFSWDWDRMVKHSVFSCHEARGNNSIARYLKVTF